MSSNNKIPTRLSKRRRAEYEAESIEDSTSSSDDDSSWASSKKSKSETDYSILVFRTREHGSNHHQWSIWMKKKLAQKFRNLSRFLMSSPPKYWLPAEVEEPSVDLLRTGNDPHGFRKKEFEKKVDIRLQIISDMEQDKYPCFNYILSRMSSESIAQVEATVQYANAKATCNPLILWNLIAHTHQTGIAGGDENEMFLEVIAAFSNVQQGPNESLKSFKAHMDATLSNMEAISANLLPTPRQQAMQFTKKLDSGRYSEMQLQARNANNRGDPLAYAATLTEAYNAALHTEVLNTKGEFVAADSSERGICAVSKVKTIPEGTETTRRSRRRQRSSRGESDASSTSSKMDRTPGKKGRPGEAVAVVRTTEKKPTMKCDLCGQEGHWIQKCHKLQEAKDAISKATVAYVAFDDGDRPRPPPTKGRIVA